MRALLAGASLLAACGSALAQSTACTPSAPRLDPGRGFVPFGAHEQAHARGGSARSGWEWAIGTNTEARQKAKGSLDWASGRIYGWTLIYSGAGAATLEIRDAGALMLSLAYPSGMDAGNVLELHVATNTSIGADTAIAATLTSLKGQAVSGSISQIGNNQESSQRLYFYYPPMAQGFTAQGTVSLTYKTLPTGSRVDFKLRAGQVPCNNVAPTVSITAPVANGLFQAATNITIETAAADADGSVAQVEFFANGSPIGAAASAPFRFNWTNVRAGVYILTARATDNAGDQTTSTAVQILVNAPPAVTLTSPTANTFTAPASISVTAEASDTDGTIASVGFYYDETLITTIISPPYSFTWTSVPQGTYSVTARATDDRGATTVSTAMPITVNSAAPAARALYFIHVDHLDTPRLVANLSGQAVWRWDQQEAFGVNVADDDPDANSVTFEFPLRLPGQYFDKETNLHYSYFREYDAGIGRFSQFDPIGLRGGANGYAFVDNNPLSRIDPFGLAAQASTGKEKMADCGPEGGWLNRFIPNNPRGYPFQKCCDAHDKCYDKCFGRSKLECDTDACGCFKNTCSGTSGSAQSACLRIAQEYCYRIMYSDTADEQFRKARAKCKSASACIPGSTL